MIEQNGYILSGRTDIKILCNGNETDLVKVLISMESVCSNGSIAKARISFQDNPSSLDKSDSDEFSIGSTVEIKIGKEEARSTIFKGIVSGRSLSLTAEGAEITITAKHEAFRMTLERKFRNFEDMSDSDIISQIIGEYGISSEVSSTGTTHEKLVQYNCSDWDFINLRAEAAGLCIVTTPSGILAKKPEAGAESKVTVQNGYSLTNLQMEINGMDRFKTIKAEGWNYSSQEMDSDSVNLGSNDSAQGKDDSSSLASKIGNDSRSMRLLSGQNVPDAMSQMAQSEALRLDLSRISGKISMLGYPDVFPTDMITIEGVGSSFDGKAFVSSVIQEFSDNGWSTSLGLGLSNVPYTDLYTDIESKPADGHLAPSHGLQVAIVEAIEGDPQGEERIRIKLMGSDSAALWARVALMDAGNARGCVFMPEIGDEVVVGFMGGNPSEPVVLGMLHSSSIPSPIEKSDDNDIKGITTRENLKLEFDDKKKNISIMTPGGNSIIISDDDKGVKIEDQNGNKVTLDSNGISLESAKDMTLKASGDVTIEGVNINIKAQSKLSAQGQASAEITSSGNTVVKGSIVQIN